MLKSARIMPHFAQSFDPRGEFAAFLSSSIARLVLAAFLGGIIGLERELSRKPAGLRTQMFICFGSALFTTLSLRMGSPATGDSTRIASNIVQGVGFLGAGAIMRERGSVTGLTTAATIFVVASIGMASGAGEYLLALFATIVILLALQLLGYLETYFNLKPIMMTYEVKGMRPDELLESVNAVLDEAQRPMQSIQVGTSAGQARVMFTLSGTLKEHSSMLHRLKSVPQFMSVNSFTSSTEQ
jgi:putative Mg2+ transporter-C (MgtC) family protein